MCVSKPPKPPAPPAPPPPPPQPVDQGKTPVTVKPSASQREQTRQAARGTAQLRIPLNTQPGGAGSPNLRIGG